MTHNGGHRRPDEKPPGSGDAAMLLVLAMLCGTVITVVWIIWG